MKRRVIEVGKYLLVSVLFISAIADASLVGGVLARHSWAAWSLAVTSVGTFTLGIVMLESK